VKIYGTFTGGPVTISVGKDYVHAACRKCNKIVYATRHSTFERLMARLRSVGCTHSVGSFQGKPSEGQTFVSYIAQAAGAVAPRWERQVAELERRLDSLERRARSRPR
jgi:hypothetical protein